MQLELDLQAVDVIDSLRDSAASDDVDFEVTRTTGDNFNISLAWQDASENLIELALSVSTYYINDENGVTYDINAINDLQLSYGDGYEQSAVTVGGINEHSISPVLSDFFDAYNERKHWSDDGFCINLISARQRNRGTNWLMTEVAL